MRETFYDAIKFTAGFVLLAALVLFVLRAPIAGLFDATGDTRALVYLFCGPLALAYVFNGWIFVGNAAYNNLGHPYFSTWINWGRSTLGMYPFVVAGAALGGAAGVLIGQAISGLVFAAISLVVAQRVLDRAGPGIATKDFVTHQREHAVANRHR